MALPYTDSEQPAAREPVPFELDVLFDPAIKELALSQSERLEHQSFRKAGVRVAVRANLVGQPSRQVSIGTNQREHPAQEPRNVGRCVPLDEDEIVHAGEVRQSWVERDHRTEAAARF